MAVMYRTMWNRRVKYKFGSVNRCNALSVKRIRFWETCRRESTGFVLKKVSTGQPKTSAAPKDANPVVLWHQFFKRSEKSGFLYNVCF